MPDEPETGAVESAVVEANGLTVNRLGANGINVNGINVNGINVNGINVNGVSLNGINVNGVTLNGINVNGINVNGINVNGINVNGINVNGINVNGINLSAINLPATTLNGIGLNGVTLDGITLAGLRLNGITLNGIKLAGVTLGGVRLNGFRLNGMKLDGLNLRGAKLDGTRMTGPQVTELKLALSYVAKCALPSGTCATVTDVDGVSTYSLCGASGLDATWDTNLAASVTHEGAVTQCVVDAASQDPAHPGNTITHANQERAIVKDLFSHVVSCALPTGTCVSGVDIDGSSYSMCGSQGLDPGWRTSAASASLAPQVAACVTAQASNHGDAWFDYRERFKAVLQYAAQCALRPDQTVTVTDWDGSPVTWRGSLGLADWWATGPLKPAPAPKPASTGEELVSACLMARTNASGNPVSISLRARPELPASQMEAWAYGRHEGAFMGNLFAASPVAQVCSGPGGGSWLVDPDTGAPMAAGRLCAEGSDCGFQNLGTCASVCNVKPGAGETLFDECGGNANVINTFLYSVVDFTAYSESHFQVDVGPGAVATGDFDGDGRLDLATANAGGPTGSTVSVLLAEGESGFAPQVAYAVGSQPRSIVAADFNGDGRPDLATANGDGHDVSVLISDLSGSFTPSLPTALGTTPVGLTAGDFNNDGRADLATANTSNNVSVLLAGPGGTFGTPATYALGRTPSSIVSGDWNGDGRADLATANADTRTVSVLLANASGTFGMAVTVPAGVPASIIKTADFNGDGKLDLAAGSDGAVSILLGNGNGTFQPGVVSALPSSRMTAGDFNGDGKADLATCEHTATTHAASVLLGTGTGTFTAQPATAGGLGCASVVAADLDGDGKTDLASADFDGDSVSIYSGTGTGGLEVRGGVAYYPVSRSDADAPMTAVADFNGDGIADLATENNASGVVVRLGTSAGTFGAEVTYDLGATVHVAAVLARDVDADGKMDVVTANWDSLSVLRGLGNGTFAPAVKLAVAGAGGAVASVAAADFNADGKLDLVTNLATGYGVFLGNGDGTFGAQVTVAGAASHHAVVAGDWNGDGKVDLASAHQTNTAVFVAWGNGNGTFSTATSLALGGVSGRARSLAAGDFNRDGMADLAVAVSGDNAVRVMLGQANKTFTGQTYTIPGGTGDATFVGTAYVDGDSLLDLMVARGSTITVFSGGDGGVFSSQGTFTVGEPVTYVAAGFLDRDPLWRVDLLASSSAGRLVMLPGKTPPTPSAGH